MKQFLNLSVLLVFSISAFGQLEISTIAGLGKTGNKDGNKTEASFYKPLAIAVDVKGNKYVVDYDNLKIRKITVDGKVSTIAGSGNVGSKDGIGKDSSFKYPQGIAVDVSGNIIVADTWNNKIRKISPLGIVSTFAGSGLEGSIDGKGTQATFNNPTGVCLDSSGNVYVADSFNHKIRKITPSGIVSTIAGTGIKGNIDGKYDIACFNNPSGIAIDANRNLFVTDSQNNKIRKITQNGDVTTLAGSGNESYEDGKGVNASFNFPFGIAVDGKGNLYVCDVYNHKIRKIANDGMVTTIAGNSISGNVDGNENVASFNLPYGIDIDTDGNIYIADSYNHKIRKIVKTSFAITN